MPYRGPVDVREQRVFVGGSAGYHDLARVDPVDRDRRQVGSGADSAVGQGRDRHGLALGDHFQFVCGISCSDGILGRQGMFRRNREHVRFVAEHGDAQVVRGEQ